MLPTLTNLFLNHPIWMLHIHEQESQWMSHGRMSWKSAIIFIGVNNSLTTPEAGLIPVHVFCALFTTIKNNEENTELMGNQ